MGPDNLSRIETGEEPTNLEEGLPGTQLFLVHITDSHFEDIIHFLTMGTSSDGYTIQQKELVMRAIEFSITVGHFYKMGLEKILQCYVLEFE